MVFDAAGKSSFGQCKRLLNPGRICMSIGPGPWDQNLILPLATPLVGGKKVVFAYPRLDQATVRHFADNSKKRWLRMKGGDVSYGSGGLLAAALVKRAQGLVEWALQPG